jgi:hypothetical protein
MLEEAHNFKQVGRARVAGWAEHAHEAFGWNMRSLGEPGESNRCVDVVAQNCLGECDLARDQLKVCATAPSLPPCSIMASAVRSSAH